MASSRTVPAGLTLRPTRVHRVRLSVVVVLLLAAFGGLTWRLFDLQVLRHARLASEASRLLVSYDPLRGLRGDIVTADGTIVAREVVEYTVALDPTVIARENLPLALRFLSRGLGLSDEERRAAQARIEDRRTRVEEGLAREQRYLLLKKGVPEGLIAELGAAMDRLLPAPERKGVIFAPTHFRQYPRGSFLGPVVGATMPGPGDTLIGAAGLELALEASLAGKDGHRKLRCEGRRLDRWYWPGEVDVHPVHGYNAILTINSQVQGIAEEELEQGLEREKAAAGTAVVMDCRSGDILAMVNLPSIDPGSYHDYPQSEFEERRRNRVIENQYEPGSTIKSFLAAVAMEKGLFRPDQRIWDGGRVNFFGRRRVEDVSDHGPISFAEAVIFSSNIGMSIVGLRMGREGLNEALDRFRFQARTGIDLPGEALGKRTPRNRWSETYTSVSVSYGYEVMVTPIQLCAAFSSLVNGGRLFRPRIVDRLEREGESIEFRREEVGRPIREETSRKMREILVEVVERGTAKMLKIPGFPFGGKTGTAARAERGSYAAREYLSSFMAFAPAGDPRVVVMVMVERPRLRHYGSTVAGPVVTGILKRLFHLPPSGSRPDGKAVERGALADLRAR